MGNRYFGGVELLLEYLDNIYALLVILLVCFWYCCCWLLCLWLFGNC